MFKFTSQTTSRIKKNADHRVDGFFVGEIGFIKSLLFAIVALTFALPAQAGFFIQNGILFDNNSKAFVMRGVNYPFCFFQSRPVATDIANIAGKKANAVRVVLSNGIHFPGAATSAASVSNVIQLCKNNKMISVLEIQDTVGFGDTANNPTACTMAQAVDYWINTLKPAVVGQENFVIVNVGNEPLGNSSLDSRWATEAMSAITRLRAAGFTHTLMFDAPDYGQDNTHTMQNAAAGVLASDPLHNVIFSVHMYEVYRSSATINAYQMAFANAELPLAMGEFGATNNGNPAADVLAVMAGAQQLGLGYLGWSWAGNGGANQPLDITLNFDPNQLSMWGNTLINSANGIVATSQICSVFGATAPALSVSPTALSFTSAASSTPVGVTSNVAWTVSSSQTFITVAPAFGSNNGSVLVSVTGNTGTAPRTGTVTFTGGGFTRTVSVTQAAATANTLTVAPASLSFTSAAGSSPVAVTSNVAWTATRDQTFITVAPASGSNNGSVAVSVSANTGTTARTGTVTITGGGIARTVTVTQAAPSANTLNVSPTSLTFTSGAGSSTFSITSNASWTISDDQTWITTTPTAGSNNANVTVTVTANTATAARTGTITVTGGGITKTISVTQSGTAATPCSNPVTITVPFAKDGPGEFCYVTSGTINFINSWNMQLIEVNGVNLTNTWVSGSNLPARINGSYSIHYIGQFPWSHFEAK